MLAGGLDEWLRREDVLPRTPFLISPGFEYDVALNEFFLDAPMAARSPRTLEAYARDLARFLNFLWLARGDKSWRDVTAADHVAYLSWRRRDAEGPRVTGSTWNREVAAVNQFYEWAVKRGHVRVNPVPQAARRRPPAEAGWPGGRAGEQRPATYAHDAGRERIEWLPPASYRLWRDAGVRGFDRAGLPRERFRGRWAARNAVFCDVMVRTGLRLSEQAALTVLEVPLDRSVDGYQRFWLPPAIAKGGSGRWVYLPASGVADLVAYAQIDRANVVADATASGRYRSWHRPLVVEDPARPVAVRTGGAARHTVKLSQLDPAERQQLLVDGAEGLAPAVFWLNERGDPLSVPAWKRMFLDSSRRCQEAGSCSGRTPRSIRAPTPPASTTPTRPSAGSNTTLAASPTRRLGGGRPRRPAATTSSSRQMRGCARTTANYAASSSSPPPSSSGSPCKTSGSGSKPKPPRTSPGSATPSRAGEACLPKHPAGAVAGPGRAKPPGLPVTSVPGWCGGLYQTLGHSLIRHSTRRCPLPPSPAQAQPVHETMTVPGRQTCPYAQYFG